MIRSVGEKRKEIDCGQKERGYDEEGEEGSPVRSFIEFVPREKKCRTERKGADGGGCRPESNTLVSDGRSGADERAA